MRILPFLLAVYLGSVTGQATFPPPRLAPVDRLVATAETYARAHPKAGEPHYILARVHYLAFASKRDQVPYLYFSEGEQVRVPGSAITRMMGGYVPPNAPQPNALSSTQLLAHATAARASFEEALRIEPKNALYHLGLASLLDEVRAWIASARPADVTPGWSAVKLADVRAAYAAALDLGLIKDAALTEQPMMEEVVSQEAAKALIRLAEAEPASLTEAERRKADEGKTAVRKFEKLPKGPITPIVLSMQPARHLKELLAPEVTVDFDLRGYGPAERWPWVKPGLGFLVWDPLAMGQVESARDLFGSYSFQIFRKTGYDALAALDDNGDGQLAGEELYGIRVWFDLNSDGVSTAAEVKSLEALGITAIAVRETSMDGIHPMNPTGLTLRDGRTLPTWDWIVAPRR